MDQDSFHETHTRVTQAMPIFVTGGAGYLGVSVIEKLSQQNQEVIASYRSKIPQPMPHLCTMAVDLQIRELLTAPLRGVSAVIHLAWDRGGGNTSPDAQESIKTDFKTISESRNLSILKNLIEAMELAKTPRIIFVSAVGADRDAKDAFLREKYECEQLIINSSIREKIIIRCAPLFGGNKDAGFVQAVKKLMKSQFFYPIPKIEAQISPLHIDDLSELILKCSLVKMYDFCAIVDLVGGEPYRASQIFKMVAQQTNKNLIPLGTFVGDFFVKFSERKNQKQEPKIYEYFALGSRIEKKIRYKNPLAKLLPEKCRTFQEGFAN